MSYGSGIHVMSAEQYHADELRAALVGLVGADGAELGPMELAMRTMPAPDEEKIAMLNAIHALQSSAERAK